MHAVSSKAKFDKATYLILSDVQGRSKTDEGRTQAILDNRVGTGQQPLHHLALHIRVDAAWFVELLKAGNEKQKKTLITILFVCCCFMS